MTTTSTAPRQLHTPRGKQVSCKGWHQEAALRMLCNKLEPDVAEKPDELIVHGGTGKRAVQRCGSRGASP